MNGNNADGLPAGRKACGGAGWSPGQTDPRREIPYTRPVGPSGSTSLHLLALVCGRASDSALLKIMSLLIKIKAFKFQAFIKILDSFAMIDVLTVKRGRSMESDLGPISVMGLHSWVKLGEGAPQVPDLLLCCWDQGTSFTGYNPPCPPPSLTRHLHSTSVRVQDPFPSAVPTTLRAQPLNICMLQLITFLPVLLSSLHSPQSKKGPV